MAETEQKENKSGSKKSNSETFDFLSGSAVFSVMMGGFLGTAARALIFILIPTMGADVIVNIIGSFFVGFFMFLPSIKNEELGQTGKLKLSKRLFIGTGFLGGFTTFSYFMLSPFLLIVPSGPIMDPDVVPSFTWDFVIQFSIYVTIVAFLGVVAAAIGKYAAEKWFKPGQGKHEYHTEDSDTNDEYVKGDNSKGVA